MASYTASSEKVILTHVCIPNSRFNIEIYNNYQKSKDYITLGFFTLTFLSAVILYGVRILMRKLKRVIYLKLMN